MNNNDSTYYDYFLVQMIKYLSLLFSIGILFRFAQQIFGTSPSGSRRCRELCGHLENTREKSSRSSPSGSSNFFDANEQFEENRGRAKTKNKEKKSVFKKIMMSPKFIKIFHRKDKFFDANEQFEKGHPSNSADDSLNQTVENSNQISHDHNAKSTKLIDISLSSADNSLNQTAKNSDQNIHVLNDKSDTTNPSDDCMECNVCFDRVKYDQFCFCDGLMADKIFGSGLSDKQNESHAFCIECLENYAKAAHETVPFARGGLGLRCMVPNCENPISWQEINDRLPHALESIYALENHCAELCVALSGIHLERCPECNCAVEMDETNKNKQKFRCPECNYEMCRECNAKWTEEHNDLSCEQFAKQQNRQGFLIDKRLSDLAIHKCNKCNIQFVKYTGCNHIICAHKNCNGTYCYCCRKSDVDKSDHYCRCFREDGNLYQCAECGKCLLWANVIELDKQKMDNIRREGNEAPGLLLVNPSQKGAYNRRRASNRGGANNRRNTETKMSEHRRRGRGRVKAVVGSRTDNGLLMMDVDDGGGPKKQIQHFWPANNAFGELSNDIMYAEFGLKRKKVMECQSCLGRSWRDAVDPYRCGTLYSTKVHLAKRHFAKF